MEQIIFVFLQTSVTTVSVHVFVGFLLSGHHFMLWSPELIDKGCCWFDVGGWPQHGLGWGQQFRSVRLILQCVLSAANEFLNNKNIFRYTIRVEYIPVFAFKSREGLHLDYSNREENKMCMIFSYCFTLVFVDAKAISTGDNLTQTLILFYFNGILNLLRSMAHKLLTTIKLHIFLLVDFIISLDEK